MSLNRFIILIFTSFILVSCKETKRNEGLTVFKYNESSGITSLDPGFASVQSNIWATNQLFNGLVQLDENMKIQPAIAKNWEIRDSSKTYIFTLRNDVYFHDNECFEFSKGRVVLAQDFVYSLNRLLDPKVAAKGAWVLKKVKSYRAVNDTTLEIKLKEPHSPFLGMLTMQYCSVVPKEAIDFYGNEFRSKPVGTGPFYFKYWKENEKLVLRKNKKYFEKDAKGNKLPYLDAIAITFIPDKQSSFLEFVKGDLDFLSGIDASYKDELLTYDGMLNPKYNSTINMLTEPYLNTEYLGILVDENISTVSESPLSNKLVRQAINYGFDRKKMMKYLRNNIGDPANSGIIPDGLPSYDASIINGYEYNPEKAKALLIQAGYPNGTGLPEIYLSTNSSYLDLCEYIQKELSQIGIIVNIDVMPPSTLREAISTQKVNFFRASWIADYADAENYLSLFYSKNFTPGGPNKVHYSNPEFDSLYELAITETNDSLRYHYYQQMDSIMIDDAPIVPLYYDRVLRFTQKNVTGLGSNAMNLLSLKKVQKLTEIPSQ